MEKGTVAIFGSLMFVAVVAVVLSQRAATSSVLQALGTGVAQDIGAATAPLNAKANS